MESIKNSLLKPVVSPVLKPSVEQMAPAYRFDIFKGAMDEAGKITKVRSVGSAYIREGHKTYMVTLKTFLQDRFFLLPNSKEETKMDYVILTREPAKNISRKYFWNAVGGGVILNGANHGLMKLSWDLLGDDLYMSLHPIQSREAIDPNAESAA